MTAAASGGAVCGFSSAEYLDTHRVRALPEDVIGAEAGRAAVPGSLQVLDMRTALLRLERTDISRDWKEYVAADFEFHAALVDAAGSSRLSKLYHTIGKEVKLCIYQSRNVVAMRNENVYHHRQVLEFLEQGDKKNAKLILARHLDAAVEGFELGFLRQQETAVNA